MRDMFCNIQEPLRRYALDSLSASALSHLRRVNRSAQQLVDQHTGSLWKAAASELLDPACLANAEDACMVQRTLREQAALLRNLLAGKQFPSSTLPAVGVPGALRDHNAKLTEL